MKRLAVLALFGAGCTNFALLAELKPRKVVVRFTDKFVQPDGGVTFVPRPKAGLAPCVVWVDVAPTRQWQKVEGTWTADGECTLRDVPPGETLLSGLPGEPNAHVTVGTQVGDFGQDFTGRPFSFAEGKTTLTVDLTGAAPLRAENAMAMYLPDFGVGLVDINGGSNASIGVPAGMVGATSFPVTFDFETLPLVRADEAIEVYQGVPFDPGNPSFTLAKRGTAKIAVLNGQNVRTSVSMSDVPSRAPGFPAFSFVPAPFYAAVEKELFDPLLIGGAVFQQALPENATVALHVQDTFHRDGGLALTATATQVDPFPGRTWSRQIKVEASWFSIARPAKGGIGGVPVGASFQGPADDLGWLSSGWMTPVRNIQAVRRDGTNVTDGLLDSTAPTLVWDVPATGLPNRYFINVLEMSTNAQDSRFLDFTRSEKFVFSDRTEAHIPPGILKPNTVYAFVVSATNCIANDPARPLNFSFIQTCANASARSEILLTPQN